MAWKGAPQLEVAVLLEAGAELVVHLELLLGRQLPSERHHARERDRACADEGPVVDVHGQAHDELAVDAVEDAAWLGLGLRFRVRVRV